MSAVESAPATSPPATAKPKPWYHTTGAVVAFLIFFFPVGIWFMWQSKSFPIAVRWIITGFFALVFLANVKSGADGKAGKSGAHVSAPKITDMEAINSNIKYLREHPPQVSEGDPKIMFWGHISSTMGARPSRIKAFDYARDGSIEGIEMFWEVNGSADAQENRDNSLIGSLVIAQIIVLVGGDGNAPADPGKTLIDFGDFSRERMNDAVSREVEKTFGSATVRYSIVQENGKNTPRYRIGKCPEF